MGGFKLGVVCVAWLLVIHLSLCQVSRASGSSVLNSDGKGIGPATLQQKIGRIFNFAIPSALIPEIMMSQVIAEADPDLPKAALDPVEKAKSIVRTHYKDNAIKFLKGPAWFNFSGSNNMQEFYTVFITQQDKKSSCYSMDIFSVTDTARNIFHNTVYSIPNIMIYQLNNCPLFIWNVIEGSGGYLQFGIFELKNNTMVEIASDSDYDGD